MSDPRTIGPIIEQNRIYALDLLRGVAVLGIFFVNMLFFSMPFMAGIAPFALGEEQGAEQLAWGFVHVFCQFKFISMFSLLFGAGLVMQMMRADAAGRPFVPIYLRRLAVLALFGLVHALALWYGDILFIYSLFGVILLVVRRVSARTLVILGLVGVAVAALLSGGCASIQLLMAGETPSFDLDMEGPPLTGLAAIKASGAPFDMRWAEAERIAYAHGPLSDALTFRGISYAMALFGSVFSYGWRIVGMFFIGAAMMKSGFFEGRQRKWVARLATGGLALGLLMELGAAVGNWLTGFEFGSVTWLATNSVHEIGSFVLCLGYVGALTWLADSPAVRRWTRPIANAGRMALTVYLSETLIATTLMYWWGFALFGTLSRVEQIGLVLVIYAGLVIFATLWLSVFRMGPMEWVWRCMTYWRLLPIRKQGRP